MDLQTYNQVFPVGDVKGHLARDKRVVEDQLDLLFQLPTMDNGGS